MAPLPVMAASAPGGAAPVTTSSAQTVAPTVAASIMTDARGWAFRVRSVSCLATGSSFAVASGLVTNRHVASGSTAVQMSTWDGTDFNASVSAISAGPDLALLGDHQAPVKTVARLAPRDAPVGTPVWVAGYPEGDQLTVTGGHIIAYISGSVVGIEFRVMEITDAIQPGNSGSALVDSSGAVVGVVFAIRLSNHRGLAIPVSELAAFLAAPGSLPVTTCAV